MRKSNHSTSRKKLGLTEKLGKRCAYCGYKFKVSELQVEHIIPHSRGGGNGVGNLVLSCGPCNNFKGTMLIEEFKKNVFERILHHKNMTRYFSRIAKNLNRLSIDYPQNLIAYQ